MFGRDTSLSEPPWKNVFMIFQCFVATLINLVTQTFRISWYNHLTYYIQFILKSDSHLPKKLLLLNDEECFSCHIKSSFRS